VDVLPGSDSVQAGGARVLVRVFLGKITCTAQPCKADVNLFSFDESPVVITVAGLTFTITALNDALPPQAPLGVAGPLVSLSPPNSRDGALYDPAAGPDPSSENIAEYGDGWIKRAPPRKGGFGGPRFEVVVERPRFEPGSPGSLRVTYSDKEARPALRCGGCYSEGHSLSPLVARRLWATLYL
jgi:hypothetical protein